MVKKKINFLIKSHSRSQSLRELAMNAGFVSFGFEKKPFLNNYLNV